MRPNILFPLFAPLSAIRGIGPRLKPFYERLCGEHVVGLLWHLPVSAIDRRYSPKLKEAERDQIASIEVKVIEHKPPKVARLPYRIIAEDETDEIIINYFNAKGDYLSKLYPLNKYVIISGKLERYHGLWNMNHPDYVLLPEQRSELPGFEPVYPLTEGLSGKMLRKTIEQALLKAPELTEWHDPSLMKRETWPNWRDAILKAHHLDGPIGDDGNAKSPWRRRLAYDELLADQLALAVIRRHHKESSGRSLKGTSLYQKKLLASVPFKLTKSQTTSIAEIAADMEAPKRMLRLLQGDVGSGKTIVALFAMLKAMEAGVQAVLMVPTEILAKQHYARLSSFLAPLNVKIGLLVGKSRGSNRDITLEHLADGSLPLVVGTHALFQDDVKFKDLGLAVVDEQHRFGVNQRLQLSDKGRGVDILVMTATPIPRTLTLTSYGDMDVSRLVDKPVGRLPIDTRLIDAARLDEVIEAVKRQISQKARAYWVCPLVEQSEISDLAAATERAKLLSERFGKENVGLVHGQMPTDAKDRVMAAFAAGEIKVLVATTVIEVGVDVPEATLMVIEHSERFGLAQLHQLRGRVGRSSEKSNCLLLYQAPLGITAKARLKMLRETEDGFLIAEEDLRLRGSGELLGTKQSGLPEFRLANLNAHADLLSMASDDAKLTLELDPKLESPRGQALRSLLYLFERDAAVPLLRSG